MLIEEVDEKAENQDGDLCTSACWLISVRSHIIVFFLLRSGDIFVTSDFQINFSALKPYNV